MSIEQALSLHKSGRLNDAILAYEALLATEPNNAEVCHYYGMALHADARPEDAVKALENAVKLAPDYAHAFLNLGRVYCTIDRRTEAGVVFQRALELGPNNPEMLATNGMFCLEEGRETEAAVLLKKTLDVSPDYPGVKEHLASILIRLKHAAEGLKLINEVLRIEPQNIAAKSIKARALKRMERTDEADSLLSEILQAAPNAPEAMITRAQIAEEKGDFEAAKEWYNSVLSKLPQNAAALSGLLALRNAHALAAPHVETAEQILEDSRLPGDPRRLLNHALGKWFEREEKFERAFQCFSAANKTISDHSTYDREKHQSFVSDIESLFTPAYFEARKSWGLPDARPIFVVGMPRSGTTLTEQILSSHPEIDGAGELGYFPSLAEAICNDASVDHYPAAMDLITQEHSRTLATNYLDMQKAKTDSKAAYIVDKLPLNFLYLGLVRMLFPNAIIIFCLRNPMDNCLSCFVEAFDDDYAFTADLEDLGHFYGQHIRLHDHWTSTFPVLSRRYEEVTADAETTTRALIDFCGLEWDDRCLRYYETKNTVRTPSKWQVRQPIYTSSVDRWRRYEVQLQPLARALEGT